MLRRITQLWPNLIRPLAGGQDDDDEEPIVNEDQMKELEKSML